MGKIDPKDIYVAKDGTVYRVAEDGSLIKLKDGPGGGEPQKAQEPYKPKQPEKAPDSYWLPKQPYQEPTGYYQETPPRNPKMKHKGWFIFLIILIIVILVGAFVCDKIQESREEASHHLKMVDPYAQTQTNENVTSKVMEEVVAEPTTKSVPAATAEEAQVSVENASEFAFYGSIGGSDIHGRIAVNTVMGDDYGWYYYDTNGSGDRIDISLASANGDAETWYEYYGDTFTGTWTLYLDYASKNFANGTFQRASDGKQFPIRLYKSNC